MVDTAWGWRLPQGYFGKGRGSRAFKKILQNGTVIHDASYWCPLCIKGSTTHILEILEFFLDPLVFSELDGLLSSLDDQGKEIETLIYEPLRFPFGAMGPLKLLILPCTGKGVCLDENLEFCLYVHGAIAQKSFRLLNQEVVKRQSVQISVADLRRIELVGTRTHESLVDCLLPISVYNDVRNMSAGEAVQISLLDPRALKPLKLGTTSKTLLSESARASLTTASSANIFCEEAAAPVPGCYFDGIRSEIRRNLIMGIEGADRLEPEQMQRIICPAIIIKNCRSGTSWSLIIPSGWIMPFWMTLILRNCQPAGQREWRWVHTWGKKAFFPQDVPDSSFRAACSSPHQTFDNKEGLENIRHMNRGGNPNSSLNTCNLIDGIWHGMDVKPFVARTFNTMFTALFGPNNRRTIDRGKVNYDIATRNTSRSLAQEGWKWVPVGSNRDRAGLGCLVEVLVFLVKRGRIEEGAKLFLVKGREADISSLPWYIGNESERVVKGRDSLNQTNVVTESELQSIGFVTSNAPYGSGRVVPSLGFCSVSSFWRLRCLQFYARKRGKIPVRAWVKNADSNALFPVNLRLNIEER